MYVGLALSSPLSILINFHVTMANPYRVSFQGKNTSNIPPLLSHQDGNSADLNFQSIFHQMGEHGDSSSLQ